MNGAIIVNSPRRQRSHRRVVLTHFRLTVCVFHHSCTGSYPRRSGRCDASSASHAPPLRVVCATTAASSSLPLARYWRERCARKTFVLAGGRMDVLGVKSSALLARKLHFGAFNRLPPH
jgi:hypothetical protein